MFHRGLRPATRATRPSVLRTVCRSASLGRGTVLAAIVGVLAVASPAVAQSEPASISNLASRTTIDTAGEARIEAYILYYVERLEAGGASASNAYRRLLEPIAGAGTSRAATRSFRGAFSSAAVRPLRRISESSDNPLVAANASIVLSKVGTLESAEALIAIADARTDRPWASRLAAARGIVTALRDDFNDTLDERARLRIGRRLSELASRETSARVLPYMLTGILEADDDDALTDGSRIELFGFYADALRTTAARGRGDTAFSKSAGRSIAVVRDRFLRLTARPDVQASLARSIAPAMVELLSAYEQHWDAGHVDDEMKARLTDEIKRCEVTLSLLVARVSSNANLPESAAADAWQSDDQAGYSAAVAALRSAVSGR